MCAATLAGFEGLGSELFGMALRRVSWTHRLARSLPSHSAMFERFTEDARRALFFARSKTVERQGDSITPEDLLGGIVWASPNLLAQFDAQPTKMLTPSETGEEFISRVGVDRGALAAHARKEIPFSGTTKLALQCAAEEADALRHLPIGPEHLLLGLLRDENSQAWRILDEARVTLREVRRILAQEPGEQS